MLPLNLLFAIAFWLQASVRADESRPRCARCLNIQLTYTLAFLLPIFLAKLSCSPALQQVFPSGAPRTLITGLLFSMVCLGGVVFLIVFNTGAFAGAVMGNDSPTARRIHFVRE
jgi:hypothetical protein